eukprot:gnl/TRDRNA2_/TRDRNA2_152154_c0_seq1.p1 gnl/TRDRNA2_/TRDRNA2_152154_c0~~gnl/TRDRNA2_/TRDRNA2_152154_c0_seq1.p1  ORF type:complete len:172 (-),score=34.59 gnl/TRDRNA2_/TRDRNA2_152154_c0_seq1:18-533(-)
MSSSFYARVWASEAPSSFRDAFAASAGAADVAAANQSEWFCKYFGMNGRGSSGPRLEGDTLKLVRREGLLVASLVPKHPSNVMTLEHALLWLALMKQAIVEHIGELKPLVAGTDATDAAAVTAHSIRLFCLHFLAFFDFDLADLAAIYEAGMEPLTARNVKPLAAGFRAKI